MQSLIRPIEKFLFLALQIMVRGPFPYYVWKNQHVNERRELHLRSQIVLLAADCKSFADIVDEDNLHTTKDAEMATVRVAQPTAADIAKFPREFAIFSQIPGAGTGQVDQQVV